MPIITLTTDFGMRDGYVGAVKGVIARLAPETTIVDLAHDIPRGDIAHAAWVVATATPEFPHETIHVVVVDPGVGGARQSVIARVPASGPDSGKIDAPRAMQLYVGPDNGVFAYLATDKVWTIKPSEVAPDPSPTFHGRDVFAHAAAALAKGRPGIYGNPTTLEGALPWGTRAPQTGRVVHIDHYGNLITDLPKQEATDAVVVAKHRQRAIRMVRTYESVEPGELLAYIGSAGTVEIAVRDGRARSLLAVERGELVEPAPPGLSRGPYR
jgi:S-adenosyl-L-methionine hydrolase (adenosine-forming)